PLALGPSLGAPAAFGSLQTINNPIVRSSFLGAPATILCTVMVKQPPCSQSSKVTLTYQLWLLSHSTNINRYQYH
ncbi:TPA: hypothetical protein ACMEN6_005907, partial [Klebsiella variicola subsp. variicola]